TSLPEAALRGWTLGLGAGDLNGDLLPEVYFANDFGPDYLLLNQSTPDKTDFRIVKGELSRRHPPSYVLGHDSFKGMGAEFADVNKDGILDIYVSNVGEYEFMEGHYLFLSSEDPSVMQNGIAPYENHGMRKGLSSSGWGWGVRMGDFNNDGALEALQATGFLKGEVDQWPEFQELAFCTHITMADISWWPRFAFGDDISGSQVNPFHVLVDDYYYDIAPEIGLGTPYLARGIATADMDGDGDLDLFYSNQWEPSQFFKNDCQSCGSFLGLNLVWPIQNQSNALEIQKGIKPLKSSRPAFGAAAVLTREDGTTEISQVDGGSGHAGQRSPQIHFGLGQYPTSKPVSVELRWIGREGQVLRQEVAFEPGWYTVYLGG
ncbi:CRTAC1 family protein, partial [bacterium]|nr:CRTAC1 family protein [bacterium]